MDFTPLVLRVESVLAAYLLGGATAAGYTLLAWVALGLFGMWK